MLRDLRTMPSVRGLAIAVSLATAGCGEYISGPDVERDPNRATQVSADLLFNSVQVCGFFIQEGHLARTAAIWMQQMAGTHRQYLAIGQYTLTEAEHRLEMNRIYLGGGLADLRRIISETESDGNRTYAGMAKVWEALTVGVTLRAHCRCEGFRLQV